MNQWRLTVYTGSNSLSHHYFNVLLCQNLNMHTEWVRESCGFTLQPERLDATLDRIKVILRFPLGSGESSWSPISFKVFSIMSFTVGIHH